MQHYILLTLHLVIRDPKPTVEGKYNLLNQEWNKCIPIYSKSILELPGKRNG